MIGRVHAEELADEPDEGSVSLFDLAVLLVEHWRLLIAAPLLTGLAALGITYLIAPTFTARTSFLPPQQQQSSAASALASLGALAGLAGSVASIRSPAEQYVAVMMSSTVSDRLIVKFQLMKVYDEKYRVDARKELARNVRATVGKKDGLITLEVDDKDPQRASDMANAFVNELRSRTGELALTEAQQRRAFFQREMENARDQLTRAQRALQGSGFDAGALKAEPRAAAEGFARLKAEAVAAEVRLQTLRRGLSDSAPEVQQQLAALTALRSQITKAEQASDSASGPDYIGKYRDYKYQETLFELFARQYEMARVDESREGPLVQVVDMATPPEKKSKPKRALIAVAAASAALLFLVAFLVTRRFWRQSAAQPAVAEKLARLRDLLRRR